MKYYQHHIRDFNNATRHLTRVERSLYRDLIEIYYDGELPLISDIKKLSKLAMVHNNDEKEALILVLDDFFELKDDGYHNYRCDAVLEKYHSNSKAKSKAGKASAAKRKQKAAKRKQNSTDVEQLNNKASTNQELITNNQQPEDHVSGKPDIEEKNVEASIIKILNLATGKKFKPVDANIKFITARLKEGHSANDLVKVINLKTGEWKNDPAMFKYLRPATLFNATKFNQYIGEVGVAVPVAEPEERKLSLGERATKAREEVEKQYFEEHQTDLKLI